MTITVQRLDADVSVAPQLGPEVMAEAKAAGFRSVINNRPDFEGGAEQPTSASVEVAARAAGLEYAFLPVAPNFQSPEEIARFSELIAAMPKPILAFCRSGTRSGKLWRAATSR
ncbi:MAG: TIGR01244 family sulfur transferase [Caldimonas sp.]